MKAVIPRHEEIFKILLESWFFHLQQSFLYACVEAKSYTGAVDSFTFRVLYFKFILDGTTENAYSNSIGCN